MESLGQWLYIDTCILYPHAKGIMLSARTPSCRCPVAIGAREAMTFIIFGAAAAPIPTELKITCKF